MGLFYRNSSYAKIIKFLRKNGFVIDQGSRHCKAAHPEKEGIIIFPRHTKIANGTTQSICNQLVDMGFDKEDIRRSIIK